MNPQRGETALEIGGEMRRLCLTLGALAEIEHALGCESLKDLKTRLKTLSAADLTKLLAALLRGGGEAELASKVSELVVHPGEVVAAVIACFKGVTP